MPRLASLRSALPAGRERVLGHEPVLLPLKVWAERGAVAPAAAQFEVPEDAGAPFGPAGTPEGELIPEVLA